MTTAREQLMRALQDKEYRDIYVSEAISSVLAAQIRSMRESRGLTQSELGARVGMAQESVSKLENPDYGRYSITTLKRLGSALDVAPIVRFAPFGELVDWMLSLAPEDLSPPSFNEERRQVGPTSVLATSADQVVATGLTADILPILAAEPTATRLTSTALGTPRYEGAYASAEASTGEREREYAAA